VGGTMVDLCVTKALSHMNTRYVQENVETI